MQLASSGNWKYTEENMINAFFFLDSLASGTRDNCEETNTVLGKIIGFNYLFVFQVVLQISCNISKYQRYSL